MLCAANPSCTRFILQAWERDHGTRRRSAGIPGCVFVHANGFIGGNATEDGATTMAVKSLEL